MSTTAGGVKFEDMLKGAMSTGKEGVGDSDFSVSAVTENMRKTIDVALPGLLCVSKPSGSREFFAIQIPNLTNMAEGPLTVEQSEAELRTFFVFLNE